MGSSSNKNALNMAVADLQSVSSIKDLSEDDHYNYDRDSKYEAKLTLGPANRYNASGLKRSLHGTIYQLKLMMLFVMRGMAKKYAFWLATEMDAAEKFDDIVFNYIKSNNKVWRFIQAKHKKDIGKNKITFNNLTSNDKEFSLQKYFISCCKIKQNHFFKGAELEDFVIITNIDFDQGERTKEKVGGKFKSLETWKNIFESKHDLESDEILHFQDFEAVKYKFKANAIPELKEVFKLNLLDSALASRQINGLRAIEDKLKAIKILHFKVLISKAKQAAENIQKECGGKKRKDPIKYEAKVVLELKVDIFKTKECDDLKEAVDDLVNRTPVKGKDKNINNLTKAFENVRDRADCVSKSAQHILENSKETLKKFQTPNSNEFERLEEDKAKLGDSERYLRELIEQISNSTSLGPIKEKIEKEISEHQLPKSFRKTIDEHPKEKIDELKEMLIKKLEKIIEEISIVCVALNDDTFVNCLDEFVTKFAIIAKFPNEEHLSKLIRSELDGKFDLLSADLVCDSFQREMLDFFKFYEDGEARFYSSTDGKKFFQDMRTHELMMMNKLIHKIGDKQNTNWLADMKYSVRANKQ